MFGRGKTTSSTSSSTESLTVESSATQKAGGKGRPTPTRREAEQRNRRPLVAGTALSPTATKAERKAARKARREELNAERARQRQAMLTGDEAHLPARDRGPARRWVRDYVDARRNMGELFLPLAIIVLAMSLISVPVVQLASVALLYGVMAAVIVDSLYLRRKLKRETESRFGEKAQGAPGYGMMRALQMRRLRMPRPQVGRGQYPR